MDGRQKLFYEIERHLMEDHRPSRYLNVIINEDSFSKCYPFTMLSELTTVEQRRKYHPEGDVWTHTLMVVDEAAERRDNSTNPRVLMWAALLHDIGKAPATKIRNGKITSYDHEKIGKEMTIEFLRQFTDDYDFIKDVAAMVRWHMEALFVLKDLPFSNISEMLEEVPLNEIALLNLCDRLGRGEMTHEKAEDEIKGIRIFVEKCREYERKHCDKKESESNIFCISQW